MSEESPLNAAVVGLRMGANHARALAANPRTNLTALCDLDAELSRKAARECAEAANGPEPALYNDFAGMLREARPDILGIATPNRFHCEMTLAAVDAGVRAIYCEKPIAVDLGEARRMEHACREAGVPLIINHQRRTGPDFEWIRAQIEAGVIGEPYLVRGTCAGDLLSDGTHLIDSVLYLTSDVEWKWVFASHHRSPGDDDNHARDGTSGGGFHAKAGWRFGHPIEEGMMMLFELETGLRVELLTGDLRQPGRPYHDIEIIGPQGSLWRSGDKADHNVFQRSGSGWEKVTAVEPIPTYGLIGEAYDRTVDLVLSGKPDNDHPMGVPYTMRGFELLMGAYESARTREVIRRPVTQEKYPLALELGLT